MSEPAPASGTAVEPPSLWITAWREPLGKDARPFALLSALHTHRHLPPTAKLGKPWSEDIGDGWVFHMNGHHDEPCLVEGTACLARHLLVFHQGQPVLLIDPSGGWGQPTHRDAFTARLAIFLETLKGEAA